MTKAKTNTKRKQRIKRVEQVQDQIPEITVSVPVSKKPVRIPRVEDPILKYNATKATGRSEFHAPEYDLSEIGRIVDTESYVRQAFNKKIGLMFKEGWHIVGSDQKIVKYIKARLDQIAQASGIPTAALFRDIGTGLVQKSNCFLYKKRKLEASGGKIRQEPGKSTLLQPVAAYFVIPAETMQYQLLKNKIIDWQQKMPNGDFQIYLPKDIIHFFYDRI